MEGRKEIVKFKRLGSGKIFCIHSFIHSSFIHSSDKHLLTSYLSLGWVWGDKSTYDPAPAPQSSVGNGGGLDGTGQGAN